MIHHSPPKLGITRRKWWQKKRSWWGLFLKAWPCSVPGYVSNETAWTSVYLSFWSDVWLILWWQIPAWQHGRHAPELMCVLMAKLLIPVPHTLYTAEARAEDHHEMEANEQKKTKVSVNWFWCPPYHCHHGGGWQDLGYNLSFMPATCGPTCSGTLHTSCGVLHMSSNPQ